VSSRALDQTHEKSSARQQDYASHFDSCTPGTASTRTIAKHDDELLRSPLAKIQFARIMIAMKSKRNFASNVLLIFGFICAIFITTLAQGGPTSGYLRSRHIPPGHVTVDRAPNFGWNLAFNLQIDGRPVTNLAQGHSYNTWLSAGPHTLTVEKVPAVGYTVPTSTTVTIQPGAEYLFVAMWDSGLVYLQPAGAWLTPGANWQNHGDGTP